MSSHTAWHSAAVVAALVAATALAGCGSLNAYEAAHDESRPGGLINARIAELRAWIQRLKAERDQMEDLALNLKNELDRMDRRIRATQLDAQIQDAELEMALAERRLSQERYAALKARQDSIRKEISAMERQRREAGQRSSNSIEEHEKQRQLDELRKRHTELKADIELALSVRR